MRIQRFVDLRDDSPSGGSEIGSQWGYSLPEALVLRMRREVMHELPAIVSPEEALAWRGVLKEVIDYKCYTLLYS